MFVAPVRRWSLVFGKCLGGAAVATFEGIVLLMLAGFALRDRIFLSPAMPGHLDARPAVWMIRDVPDPPRGADHRVRDG
jgi:ABC-type Na+ efflux pump permease subunit